MTSVTTTTTQPAAASTAAAGTATSASATAGSADTGAASAALAGNEQQFLQLLLTQLQNQDPSSPVDPTQFTSELVQYATVEQQINTNTNLGQLIQLTQADTMIQSAAIVGKQVAVQSSKLSLQNSTAAVQVQLTQPQSLVFDVYSSGGAKIAEQTINGTAGTNTWTWNGTDANGTTYPDGAYTVAVTAASGGTTATAVPFTVVGTATGVQSNNNTVSLQLGALSVDFSAVTAVEN